MERIKEALYNDKPARSLDLTDDEKLLVRDLHLLTMKPVLYAANVSEDEVANSDGNPFVKIVREFAAARRCGSCSDQCEGGIRDR